MRTMKSCVTHIGHPLLVLGLCLGCASPIARAEPVLISSNTTIGPTDTEIQGVPLEVAEITVQSAVLTINGRHVIRSLTLQMQSSLTHSGSFTHDYSNGDGLDIVTGAHLIVSQFLAVDSTSSIDVSARGHGRASGPGTSAACNETGGAGHGGNGGRGRGCSGGGTYGSYAEPTAFGSGAYGASCGSVGGGAIRLDIGSSLIVDGVIRANGENANCNNGGGGGGAGGSVWISCAQITGAGEIQVIGGASADGNRGGGGGGRIAVYYNQSSFSGGMLVHGGSGYQRGGAGTIFVRDRNVPRGTLIIDNDGLSGSTTDWNEPSKVDADLIVGGAARLSCGSDGTLYLQVTGDVVIEADGFVDVNSRGYGRASGPGTSDACNETGGAGHGGHGGRGRGCGAGDGYGSMEHPTTLGSGAYGPSCGSVGAGAIRLDVRGSLLVDGVIRANGGDGNCNNNGGGGGAGGSVWITCEHLDGEGWIQANGGRAADSNRGGGGGGRVAIYAWTIGVPSNQIQVAGGWGYRSGASGSLYTSNRVPRPQAPARP